VRNGGKVRRRTRQVAASTGAEGGEHSLASFHARQPQTPIVPNPNHAIPGRFLPQRNARNSRRRGYVASSLRTLRSFAANSFLVAGSRAGSFAPFSGKSIQLAQLEHFTAKIEPHRSKDNQAQSSLIVLNRAKSRCFFEPPIQPLPCHANSSRQLVAPKPGEGGSLSRRRDLPQRRTPHSPIPSILHFAFCILHFLHPMYPSLPHPVLLRPSFRLPHLFAGAGPEVLAD
jgi:hypothetical protein